MCALDTEEFRHTSSSSDSCALRNHKRTKYRVSSVCVDCLSPDLMYVEQYLEDKMSRTCLHCGLAYRSRETNPNYLNGKFCTIVAVQKDESLWLIHHGRLQNLRPTRFPLGRNWRRGNIHPAADKHNVAIWLSSVHGVQITSLILS